VLLVRVSCSDCLEESEVVVDDLDAVDREVCRCGYNLVVLSVADFIPIDPQPGELVELAPRRQLDRAA